MTVVHNGATFTRVTASDAPPTLDMLLGFGEGPIQGYLLDTAQLNGQPLLNFPGVQVFMRLGTPDQTPIAEFNETRNTFADGRDLPDNSNNTGQEIVYTTTEPVTAFVLNIVWNQGLFHMTGKGEKEVNEVTVSYRFKVSGTTDFQGYFQFRVAGERTAPCGLGFGAKGYP